MRSTSLLILAVLIVAPFGCTSFFDTYLPPSLTADANDTGGDTTPSDTGDVAADVDEDTADVADSDVTPDVLEDADAAPDVVLDTTAPDTSDSGTDAPIDVPSDVVEPPRSLCPPGAVLPYNGGTAQPGDACGACGDGVLVCVAADVLECVGASSFNACGGCGPLPGEINASCGFCGGRWVCAEDSSLECNAPTSNLCGGCDPLSAPIGDPCSFTDGQAGLYACGPELNATCVPVDGNACGGTDTLSASVGDPCGACGLGTYVCDGTDGLKCDGDATGLNACGGCNLLAAAPGESCGECEGTYVCSGIDAVVCQEPARNVCGGCAPLGDNPLGAACGDDGMWACTDVDTVQCVPDAANACGGLEPLDATPGEPCGACDDGRWQCQSTEAVACIGDSGTNACGGCGYLPGTPGMTCGANGTWICDTDAGTLTCVDSGTNGCGGTSVLSETLGDHCGTCGTGIIACDGPEATWCAGEDDGAENACGGCSTLTEVVDSSCGPCGWDKWACIDENTVACSGNSSDACGGCTTSPVQVGDACGTCDGGEWTCNALTLECDDSDVITNDCGGCTVLEGPVGGPCGPCGLDVWECDTSGGVRCDGETSSDCGLCPAAMQSDPANCGACGVSCRPGETCDEGRCLDVCARITGLPCSRFEPLYIKPTDPDSNDMFGSAVAVHGDIMVVGAPREDDATLPALRQDIGAAYVYEQSGTGWTFVTRLTAPTPASDERFGAAVAVHGDVILVGQPNSASGVGRVHVFGQPRTGDWSWIETLTAPDARTSQGFGSAIDFDGTTAAIGAPIASGHGAVFVFLRDATSSTFSFGAMVTGSMDDGDELFGASVAISGTSLVVGAPGQQEGSLVETGVTYVFTDGVTGWSQAGILENQTPRREERFGAAVAVAGDRLAIGMPGHSSSDTGIDPDTYTPGAIRSGAAQLFALRTTGGRLHTYKGLTVSAGDALGASIGVLGNIVIAGAPLKDPRIDGTYQTDAGAVFIYDAPDAFMLTAPNGDEFDEFGTALAFDGTTLVVGAPGEDSSDDGIDADPSNNRAANSGAVYVWTFAP